MGEPLSQFLTTGAVTEELSSHPSMPFLRQEVERFLEHALSDNTWKAYRTDWGRFEDWCAERDLVPLPALPETVASLPDTFSKQRVKLL